MKSIFSGFVLLLITLIIFTSFSLIGQETPTANLDVKSQQVLLAVNKTLVNDVNVDSLVEETLINDTNAQDKTSFGFEFLTASSSANKKIDILSTITNSPDIIIATTGANVNDFSEYTTIGKWFLGILLTLVVFDAIFTRRVFNK